MKNETAQGFERIVVAVRYDNKPTMKKAFNGRILAQMDDKKEYWYEDGERCRWRYLVAETPGGKFALHVENIPDGWAALAVYGSLDGLKNNERGLVGVEWEPSKELIDAVAAKLAELRPIREKERAVREEERSKQRSDSESHIVPDEVDIDDLEDEDFRDGEPEFCDPPGDPDEG